MAVLCCIPDPPKKWTKACCCLPLALVVLVVSTFLCAYGGFEIWRCVDAGFNDWSSYLLIVLASLFALCGLGGFAAVFLKMPIGATLLSAGLKLALYALIAMFIIQWVYWGLDLGGVNRDDKWQPETKDIVMMSVYTLLCVIAFTFSWWVFGVVGSYGTALRVGKTGWEKEEEETPKRGDNKNDDDDDV
eukprot:GHVO01039913.1.p2 GENE.GHVO01039913.1~~GHVO01039913.1.p2  ORF type:complete len:189 (+),score=35.88 GHVO01039913.1:1047-1613(+)